MCIIIITHRMKGGGVLFIFFLNFPSSYELLPSVTFVCTVTNYADNLGAHIKPSLKKKIL